MKFNFILYLIILFVVQDKFVSAQIVNESGTTISVKNGTYIVLGSNYSNSGTLSAASGSTISFRGSGTQTISKTGGETVSDLIVNKPSGNLSLNSNITVNGTLTLASGNISTGSSTVILGSSSTLSGEQSGRYIIGNLQAAASVGSGQSSTFNSAGITISSAAENLGTVTVNRISGSSVTLNGNSGINRRWKINPQNALTVSRDITFTWISDDDNGKTLTSFQGWKSTDDFATTGNTSPVGSTLNATSRSVTETITSLAAGINTSFTFAQSTQPLPVELTDFTALVEGNSILLKWQTATELNNYGFEIERSHKEGEWSKIGFVKGNGNTNSIKNYFFADDKPFDGKTSYRIKQVDNDGQTEYYKSVEVSFMKPIEFAVKQNYPNPFNPSTVIEFSVPNKEMISLKVFDILGREVAILVNEELTAGRYSVNFDASLFSSGVYFYSLHGNSVNLTKKMTLTK